MKKQTTVVILAICVALLVGAGSTFMLMHDDGPDDPSLPPGIYGLPLSKLWTIVTDQTGIDNSTATLSQLMIKTAQDGSLESLILDFYGDDEGIHRWYHVEVNHRGAITWRSSEINRFQPEGTHPLNLLTEIEQIPYGELIGERAGLSIYVDSQSGDLRYDASNCDLFVLDTGELTPLKTVVFHTDEPIYYIAISQRAKDEPVTVSGDDASVSVTISQSDVPCCVAFTLPDLEKAETVEYG